MSKEEEQEAPVERGDLQSKGEDPPRASRRHGRLGGREPPSAPQAIPRPTKVAFRQKRARLFFFSPTTLCAKTLSGHKNTISLQTPLPPNT